MALNIAGEGGYGQVIPAETWTFAYTTDVTPVPLPGSLGLLGVALASLGVRAWRNRA